MAAVFPEEDGIPICCVRAPFYTIHKVRFDGSRLWKVAKYILLVEQTQSDEEDVNRK